MPDPKKTNDEKSSTTKKDKSMDEQLQNIEAKQEEIKTIESGLKEEKFEEALSKLEKIVGQLESGNLDLDESLQVFEEGIRLSRVCMRKLDSAQQKIESLLKEQSEELKALNINFNLGDDSR